MTTCWFLLDTGRTVTLPDGFVHEPCGRLAVVHDKEGHWCSAHGTKAKREAERSREQR